MTIDILLSGSTALAVDPHAFENNASVVIESAFSLDHIVLEVELHRASTIRVQENALSILLVILPGTLQNVLLSVLLQGLRSLSRLHHVLLRNVSFLLCKAIKHCILVKTSDRYG